MVSSLQAQRREGEAQELLASGRHLEKQEGGKRWDWGSCWSFLPRSVVPQGCRCGAGRVVVPELLL